MVKSSTILGLGVLGVAGYFLLRPKQEDQQQGGGGGFSFGIPFFDQSGGDFGGGTPEPFSFEVQPLNSTPQFQPSGFDLNEFFKNNNFFGNEVTETKKETRLPFSTFLNTPQPFTNRSVAQSGIFAFPNLFEVIFNKPTGEKRFVGDKEGRGDAGSGAFASTPMTKKEQTIEVNGFTSEEEASNFMSISPNVASGGSSSRGVSEVGSTKKQAKTNQASKSLFLGTQANASQSQSQRGNAFTRIISRFAFIF